MRMIRTSVSVFIRAGDGGVLYGYTGVDIIVEGDIIVMTVLSDYGACRNWPTVEWGGISWHGKCLYVGTLARCW